MWRRARERGSRVHRERERVGGEGSGERGRRAETGKKGRDREGARRAGREVGEQTKREKSKENEREGRRASNSIPSALSNPSSELACRRDH